MARGILLGEGGAIIKNGDFAIGDTTKQEAGIIIKMPRGISKNDPILGVGLVRKMKSVNGLASIKKDIRVHLRRDGKVVSSVKIEGNKIIPIIDEDNS